MTWWMRTVRAAWARVDAWTARRADQFNSDRLAVWWTEPRLPAVEDTGSIVATPEDLAEIGIADPVRIPGQRYEGRHARPSDFGRDS